MSGEGIVGEYVTGPYFSDKQLNGAMYLNFLGNSKQGLLEDSFLIRITRVGLHDGASAHCSAEV